MKCSKCGKEIADDSVFCEFCGMKVEKKSVKKSSITSVIYGGLIVAAILLGIVFYVQIFEAPTESEGSYVEDMSFVDLGLPSGTLWKAHNEEGYYPYSSAIAWFGSSLPTETQARELISCCEWSWNGSGYFVTGPNGCSIYLPAEGSGWQGDPSDGWTYGEYGFYCFIRERNNNTLYFDASEKSADISVDDDWFDQSIRLVQSVVLYE